MNAEKELRKLSSEVMHFDQDSAEFFLYAASVIAGLKKQRDEIKRQLEIAIAENLAARREIAELTK